MKHIHIPFTCLLVLCFIIAGADSVYPEMNPDDTPISSEYSNTSPGSPAWSPSQSLPDKYDWIQLSSGEWLKGDLHVLYDNKLEFDSDELGLLELDWEDVTQIRGHKPNSVRFEGPVTIVGILKVIDNRVFVITGEETREFERSRLVTVAPAAGLEELNYWSAKVSASLDIKKGNADQIDYSSTARIQRRTSDSRFYIDYRGILARTEGIETSNSQRLNSFFDYLITRNFFWRPAFGEYYRDPFSNIETSFTIGSGVGYYFIKTPETEFLLAPGLAYQYTENVSVETGEDKKNSTPALVVTAGYDTELNKMTDFIAQYRFNIVNEESGTYTHHLSTALEFELTNRLDLDLTFVWDRIQDPTAETDGRVPDQDDFYFFCGIGFEL